MISDLLPSLIPLLVAAISAVPLILTARNQRQSHVPKSQADAIQTLIGTVETLLDPLNARIQKLEADAMRQRQIDRVQEEIIRTQSDFVSHLSTAMGVLVAQLQREGLTPAFLPNGEMHEFRQRLQEARETLRKLESGCAD